MFLLLSCLGWIDRAETKPGFISNLLFERFFSKNTVYPCFGICCVLKQEGMNINKPGIIQEGHMNKTRRLPSKELRSNQRYYHQGSPLNHLIALPNFVISHEELRSLMWTIFQNNSLRSYMQRICVKHLEQIPFARGHVSLRADATRCPRRIWRWCRPSLWS